MAAKPMHSHWFRSLFVDFEPLGPTAFDGIRKMLITEWAAHSEDEEVHDMEPEKEFEIQTITSSRLCILPLANPLA